MKEPELNDNIASTFERIITMSPDEYQRLAARTDCDRTKNLLNAITHHGPLVSLLFHSLIGMMGEIGEIASALEKWIYYNQELDKVNIKEEAGDAYWYLAQCLRSIGVKKSEAMEANIAKLKKRFPDKYSDEKALESNRDRTAERETLKSIGPTNAVEMLGGVPVWVNKSNRSNEDYAKMFGQDLREQTGSGFAEPPEEKTFPDDGNYADTIPPISIEEARQHVIRDARPCTDEELKELLRFYREGNKGHVETSTNLAMIPKEAALDIIDKFVDTCEKREARDFLRTFEMKPIAPAATEEPAAEPRPSNSYIGKCRSCGKPIHRTNKTGVCASCYNAGGGEI